jgi:hypothetical protein
MIALLKAFYDFKAFRLLKSKIKIYDIKINSAQGPSDLVFKKMKKNELKFINNFLFKNYICIIFYLFFFCFYINNVCSYIISFLHYQY